MDRLHIKHETNKLCYWFILIFICKEFLAVIHDMLSNMLSQHYTTYVFFIMCMFLLSSKIKKSLWLQINTFCFSDLFVLLLAWVSLWEPRSMFNVFFPFYFAELVFILQKYICLIQRNTLKHRLAKKSFFSCFVLACIYPFSCSYVIRSVQQS